MTNDRLTPRHEGSYCACRFPRSEERALPAGPRLFVICHLSFVIRLISLCLPGIVFADGGSVQLHSVSGPFDITLFAEPPLPRAGQLDFSVLIHDSKTVQPVLDAAVTFALTPVQVHQNEQPA